MIKQEHISPQISVIVPSLNGAKRLPSLLNALQQQTFKAFELIVVIDGSTDESYTILKNFKVSFPVIVITQENQGRAAARNTAAQYAQSPLLVSMDDDMRPLPDCLQKHYEFHAQNSNVILGGRQVGDPNIMTTEIQRFKLYMENQWLKELPAQPIPLSPENLSLTAANLSIPTSLFAQLGGFDARLRNAVDIDLAMRAYLAGVSIYFAMDIVAWHDDRITCRSYILRQREYRKAYQLLHKLKPEVVEQFPHVRQHTLPNWKKNIFRLFSLKFFVDTIDNFNFYRFILPRKLRYYFYNRVIFGLGQYFPNLPI